MFEFPGLPTEINALINDYVQAYHKAEHIVKQAEVNKEIRELLYCVRKELDKWASFRWCSKYPNTFAGQNMVYNRRNSKYWHLQKVWPKPPPEKPRKPCETRYVMIDGQVFLQVIHHCQQYSGRVF